MCCVFGCVLALSEGNKEHPKTQHTLKRNSRIPTFSGVLRSRVLFVLLWKNHVPKINLILAIPGRGSQNRTRVKKSTRSFRGILRGSLHGSRRTPKRVKNELKNRWFLTLRVSQRLISILFGARPDPSETFPETLFLTLWAAGAAFDSCSWSAGSQPNTQSLEHYTMRTCWCTSCLAKGRFGEHSAHRNAAFTDYCERGNSSATLLAQFRRPVWRQSVRTRQGLQLKGWECWIHPPTKASIAIFCLRLLLVLWSDLGTPNLREKNVFFPSADISAIPVGLFTIAARRHKSREPE